MIMLALSQHCQHSAMLRPGSVWKRPPLGDMATINMAKSMYFHRKGIATK